MPGDPGEPSQPPRPDALFVYGTLLPGHLRWSMIADAARGHEPARVAGRLYDTGNGWPAAVIDDPEHATTTIPGALVTCVPEALDALLPTLDAMEGIGAEPNPSVDPYVRRVVEVTIDPEAPGGLGAARVRWAWVYDAVTVEPTWRQIDRWDHQPES